MSRPYTPLFRGRSSPSLSCFRIEVYYTSAHVQPFANCSTLNPTAFANVLCWVSSSMNWLNLAPVSVIVSWSPSGSRTTSWR